MWVLLAAVGGFILGSFFPQPEFIKKQWDRVFKKGEAEKPNG